LDYECGQYQRCQQTSEFQLLLKQLLDLKANLASPTLQELSGIDKRWLDYQMTILAMRTNQFAAENSFRFKSAIKLTSFTGTVSE
jgi:hypothetical protein